MSHEFAQLREWGATSAPLGAAVELLIHTGLADDGRTWVVHDRAANTWSVNFDTAIAASAHLPAGEQAVLYFAAALADGDLLELRECLTVLNRYQTRCVMIAIAHATGRHRITFEATSGQHHATPIAPLATWDDAS